MSNLKTKKMFGIKKEVIHAGLVAGAAMLVVFLIHDNMGAINKNGGFKLMKDKV